MKKLICCILAITCLTACFVSSSIPVYAVENLSNIETARSSSIIPDAEGYTLSYTQLTNYNGVTEYGYINNWNNFRQYYTTDFNEYAYGNNCGPTQVANLLSYYKSVGYIHVFPNDIITQSFYTNTICDATNYRTNIAMNLNDAANGFKEVFEDGADYYSVTISNELSLSWNNFKALINSNKPLIISTQSHMYFVLGYQIRNGVKYYVCYTAWNNISERYALIEYSTFYTNRKSITIN